MELSVLNAGFAKVDDQWNYGPVSSSFFRLYLVTEGQAVVKTDSEHVLCPGHLYLIPAFTTHYDSSRGTFRHIYIHFYDHQHVLLYLLRNYRIPFSIRCTPLVSQLFHHLMEVLPNLSLSNPVPDSYNSTSTILCLHQPVCVAPHRRQDGEHRHYLATFGLFLQEGRDDGARQG